MLRYHSLTMDITNLVLSEAEDTQKKSSNFNVIIVYYN